MSGELKDSGTRKTYSTGAQRDADNTKYRPGLISPIFVRRLGEHLRKGAVKYQERNWEKGVSTDRCMESLLRHANQYREGLRDEDHLAAIACNIMFIIHTLEMVERGLLPKELDDMVSYMKTGDEKGKPVS